MFSKENRISRPKEYNNIYKYGKKRLGRYIILFYIKNNLELNRFGFVASKKIGNAVTRNRAKRIMRSIVRQKVFIKNGYDIVIVTKRNIVGAEFKDIEKDFDKVTQKEGLC
ncbi:Ribonuclease P protein component [Candidatus Syntrophocurvum alkaliphilum]|uniref:Ribonuclease P protein component n=1 Tax=Candidatus Syntrophocurvum alkaliphilum TaxID=2293317 RepID=A0A6I6DL77_9FIRM|nr:ribonuclease P protein component [Candidatus Syntrophocurvum alkaliphilum]QGU00610.1 Ribonuclease P protein component [Candidatus Syntrophocurvum alkaliphilum]